MGRARQQPDRRLVLFLSLKVRRRPFSPPVGARLCALAICGAGLYALDDLLWLSAAAVGAVGLLILVRPSWSALGRAVRWPLIFAALLLVAHGASGDWGVGAVAALRLSSLIALALALSFTTSVAAMTDALERGLAPFERWGLLNAAKVSMAIALTLRFAPTLAALAQTIRDAQAARGGGGGLALAIGALLGQSLRQADLIAQAMEARGWPPEER